MVADPKPLTRNQIAAIVGNDPEAIRAIERLFKVAGQDTPGSLASLSDDVTQVLAQADSATVAAQQALASLIEARQSLDLLALAPTPPPAKRLAYGTFYDVNTQQAAAINTAYTVSFSNTDLSFGVFLTGSPTTRITVDQPGLYDFQHSIQLDKATGGKGLFYLWYRKNGTDVAESATRIRLEGNNSEQVAAWNYVFDLKAGDYIEYRWAVNDTGVEIVRFAAASPVPGIPSVIVTVTNNIKG